MKRLFIIGIGLSLAIGAAACGGGTSSADKTSTAGAGGAKTPAAGATKAATAPAATTAPATKAAATTVATKAAEATAESTEASGAAPTAAELKADIASLKTIMAAVIAKAQAGDVQGTRDTEGTMDTAMEAIVKAVRAVNPALADQIEQQELDIEHQADADTTDLAVIIKDAQALLGTSAAPGLLDQAATALKVSP